MPLSALDEYGVRLHAKLLIDAYVPSDIGDIRFQHIIQDYHGSGNTAAFLCHWLMWRLGCNNANIVNRNAPGFKYVIGQNIARIWNIGKKPFIAVIGNNSMQQGLRPKFGDIIFIKQDPNLHATEHVFVFYEEFTTGGKTMWWTAEAGQKNDNNQESAQFKQRELKLGKTAGARLSGNVPEREIWGWISLAELTYSPLPPLPPPPFDPLALGTEDNWRWCNKCQGLFWGGDPAQGACPTGGAHDSTGSGNYSLSWLSIPFFPAQPNWRWCFKCQGLFFAGNPSLGVCPADGIAHDPTQSADYNYNLTMNVPFFPGQHNWRCCNKCQGLFFAGNPSQGICPAGDTHDMSQSGNYGLFQK